MRSTSTRTRRSSPHVWGEGGGLVRINISGRWTGRVYEGLRIITRILIEEMLRPHTQAPKETVAFLEDQLSRVIQELKVTEAQITSVKTATATALPEVQKLVLANYGRVSADRLKAEAELVEERKVAEEMTSVIKMGGGSRGGEALARAKATLQKLRATYTSEHPEVKAAAATVARLEQAAAAAAPADSAPKSRTVRVKSKETREATRDADALEDKVAFLRGQEDKLLEEISLQAGNEQQLLGLSRAYDVKSKVYATLLQRFEDAKVSLSLATLEAANKVRIIDLPAAPKHAPVFSWFILLAGGVAGGLFLGLSGVLVFEFLDRSVRQREEAEAIAGIPPLATMPELGG